LLPLDEVYCATIKAIAAEFKLIASNLQKAEDARMQRL
jgi:hypothetical protein